MSNPLPNVGPIHLGELLKDDKKKDNKVHILEDHKEIIYQKALLSELSPNELPKRQAEDKKIQVFEKIRLNYLTNMMEEEMHFSRVNKMKLLADWRVIMRIAKIDEIRKYLDLYMQMFERDLDDKDAILQMLDRDITEAEEHYNIALTNHFIHIKQLMSLQDSRIKGLFKEFEKDVSDLEIEFSNEFEDIIKNYSAEKSEILKMLNNIKENYNEKINKFRMEFQELTNSHVQKITETYSHIQEAIRKAGGDENSKFNTEMNDIKQKAEDKNNQDISGILKLNKLEKEVLEEKKKVEKQNEDLKNLKIKIKQNNEDWDQKNDSLKNEKEKIMESYRILKSHLIKFRNNQREKLKKLVKNSWDCVSKLKEYIKLAEKILKLAEISRRLETEREKILPYYENSDIDREEAAQPQPEYIKGVDGMLYEEVEALQNFWKRYNKVKLDVIAIKKQKIEVDKQNELLKSLLQQYYDGLTVNNVVMTNENPLMMIDSFGKSNPITPENDNFSSSNRTLQEASHIVMDLNKQLHFNFILNK